VAAKSRQFTTDKTGKGQFLDPRKPKESGRGESCENDFVSTKSSFAMFGASGQGT